MLTSPNELDDEILLDVLKTRFVRQKIDRTIYNLPENGIIKESEILTDPRLIDIVTRCNKLLNNYENSQKENDNIPAALLGAVYIALMSKRYISRKNIAITIKYPNNKSTKWILYLKKEKDVTISQKPLNEKS
ncbi:683_t:CDS:1 [Acaulospora colombiana]|uniref:683_t:CDS:1 n=1 Tax=Acaulospora colombiana TaxID=27376 RepID=A0ACA9L131_9GLOM|nr:683_t:CDS:1 [Acaulospora colombiana]